MTELMEKGAISKVCAGEENKCFHSFVPKKTGRMRLILNLSMFNNFIMKRPFHIVTIKHGVVTLIVNCK